MCGSGVVMVTLFGLSWDARNPIFRLRDRGKD